MSENWWLEVEFGMELMLACLVALCIKAVRKRRKKKETVDEESHWI